ncbi:sulfotransferase family protein [Streptomyces sp. NBC_01803]|uniref:sulfotransferase family protein n=1 Tax=Streptomyces sp. NBC_01803 TaxID=2975946 RepID=UPI002DD7ED88|nr:sulfotransferase [Streptomyces sp. NBC_01803]WSA46319.1 sulfotransferase [Streptomyces sp. NBC_01803]
MRHLTFIVGTGRSGSTLLSRILNLHPGILSLNELFASLQEPDRALPAEPVTGDAFWRILSDVNPVFDALIRAGVPLPEFLRPRPAAPALCLMALPHLTNEPDSVLDDLAREITRWPRRPAPAHYRAFFDLLSARFGRGDAVVERSGYSLHWIPRLRAAFPTARFVHLYRNGPDCALSMSRHVGYRVISLLRDPPADLTVPFDPAAAVARDLPVTRFGALWSELITEGVAHLDAVPPGLRTTMAYEDLLAAPDRELSRLAAFAGATSHASWLTAAGSLLDPTRQGASRHLAPDALAHLRASCAPGTRALARAR